MDAAPPMIVEIQKTERHDIKPEVIEYVARLLCRAAGDEPDRDVRYVQGGFQTVHIPEPMNRAWYKYHDTAVERLKELFKP